MDIKQRAENHIKGLRKRKLYVTAEVVETLMSRNKVLIDELANAAILLHRMGDEKSYDELTLVINDMISDNL